MVWKMGEMEASGPKRDGGESRGWGSCSWMAFIRFYSLAQLGEWKLHWTFLLSIDAARFEEVAILLTGLDTTARSKAMR